MSRASAPEGKFFQIDPRAAVDIIQRMTKHYLLLAGLAVSSAFCAAPGILSQTKPANSVAANQVPFVGCASDGQAGPQSAPTGPSKAVGVSAAAAHRLAWYKAQYGPGVLAPRGWHCFSIYGSNGGSLFVSPDPIDAKALFSDDWKGFPGQVIQLSFDSGGTSGRFEVAMIIAHVFPAYKAFVQSVIAEGMEPATDFPFGPYPPDKLTYRAKNIVEFETPGNAQGLGTDSRLQMNASPIEGVAIVSGADTDLTHLSARVAATDRDLIPAIVKQVESDAASATQ
jgi:hypothetical protein